MLEGLAVWALFIYILRLVGMPWNKGTKSFAYLGGTSWLLFVWVGLINYTPMDISGGSVVQSPHIQLRPSSPNVNGKVERIHIGPNETIKKGQLIYEIEQEPYQIAFDQANANGTTAKIAVSSAKEDILLAKNNYEITQHSLEKAQGDLDTAKIDLALQQKMLTRYQEQNAVVKNTITDSDIDKQVSIVAIAEQTVKTLNAELNKSQVNSERAQLDITKYELAWASRLAELDSAEQVISKAQWDLDSTRVYAPADGFVTNFILREGQLISRVPRLQMYTDEKYVLMRVNHQAIRNVKPGQLAEYSSSVYPGKIFSAEVEGIVEATGEAQSNLLGIDPSVRSTTGKNVANKHHFVRLKVLEDDEHDLPVGAVGLAWISGEKPVGFMSFLDVIRGIIIRMKSQLYFFYSV
ncbi:HlyD family secretion protein [uncultured Vibrio sp.]|uniref:HlyD family secretion protein n=1 Tax=uncultured Vibrio sp. TaxID=114054 RepID=UPI0025F9051C|nr:biotin/lipoyl-binding protein [uncultured Vibrio sp.]